MGVSPQRDIIDFSRSVRVGHNVVSPSSIPDFVYRIAVAPVRSVRVDRRIQVDGVRQPPFFLSAWKAVSHGFIQAEVRRGVRAAFR